MPTASRATPETLAALRETLREVLTVGDEEAADIEAALRSAVRAVVPGRQQKKNLTPLIDAARKAFVRTLRRRAAK